LSQGLTVCLGDRITDYVFQSAFQLHATSAGTSAGTAISRLYSATAISHHEVRKRGKP